MRPLLGFKFPQTLMTYKTSHALQIKNAKFLAIQHNVSVQNSDNIHRVFVQFSKIGIAEILL